MERMEGERRGEKIKGVESGVERRGQERRGALGVERSREERRDCEDIRGG